MSNWAIDGIDFLDYGVYVSRSQGVIDIPPLANISHDWLDENGKEYWENEVRYGDREIVLNCWIRAVAVSPVPAYENFISKVLAFYSAIYSAGSKTLTTPFGYVFDVYVMHGIDVTRECNYIAAEQIGTFTLRLTVVGDTAYKALAVFRTGTTPVGFLFYDENGLKVQKRLLGENYVSCTFEQDNNVVFLRNDYIFVDVTGNKYEKYFIDSDPQVRKLSSNKFVVNYQFIHESFRLKNCAFLFDSDAEFFWYANADEIVDKIIENADRTFSGLFVKGTVDSTLRRNHTFSGENCYQVLQRIAAEYELEFGFVYNYPVWTVNVQSKISRNWPYTLEYGRGNGLYEITRESVNSDNLCTRLYAYGSTKNIPATYGYKRLKCPTMPVVLNESVHGKKEKVHTFDDIYPNRTGTVESYLQLISPDGETRGTAGTEYEETDFEVYRIGDTTLFDINEYLLGGLTAKVCMKTGQCAGLEFEILRYDHDNHFIFLIPFKDERGEKFPSAAFPIEAGDEYTLVDIELPSEYLDQAHADVQAAAVELIADLAVPDVVYRAVVDPAFMQNNFDGLEEYKGFNIGDAIGMIDSDLALNSLCRVSELTKIYYTGQYELVLSERKMLTAREKMNIRLDRIERYQKINRDNTTEVVRKDVETTNELRNRLLDPIDDKLQLDAIVRHESIDPGMLSFDAGVPQFFLKGMMVEANYGDDPNKVYVSDGYLIITNYYTESRYDIKKKRDAAIEYDPSRSWHIPGQVYDMPSSSLQYAYVRIRLDETETEGEIVFDTDHIEVKRYISDNELYYKLGFLSAVESPRGIAMLWGNVKQPSNIEFARSLIGIPKYGSLYNEDALTDVRNICAPGWHVPTKAEMQALYDEVNNGIPDDETGLVLKSLGLTYWASGHTANDRKGFDLRGTGKRNADGTFSGIQENVHMGSTTSDVWTFEYDNEGSTFETVAANVGRVLRPIADTTTLVDEGQTGWYTGNDGKIYRTRLLYGVEWVVENVSETYYQDGSPIEKVEDAEDWAALESGAWCMYDNDDTNGFTNGKISDFVEAKAKDAVNIDLEVADAGDMPTVSNTNNVLKLQLKDKKGNELSHVKVGSNAALKMWHGDEDDLPEVRSDDTIYYVNEPVES